MLKFQNQDQNEEIQILKTARKNQNKRLKDVENELSELKSKNDEKTIKIDQLEKMIEDQNKLVSKSLAGNQPETIVSASSGQSVNTATSPASDQLTTSCNDLLSNGHSLNGIYPIFDPKIKMVIMAFCDLKNGGKGYSYYITEIKSPSIFSFPTGS